MRMIILIFFLSLFPVLAQTPAVPIEYHPGGPVYSSIENDGKIYICGDFPRLSTDQNYFAVLKSNGIADKTWPQTDYPLQAIAADGEGGWFIAGAFSTVGGTNVLRFTRIKADKSVDPNFSYTIYGDVYCITVHGATVYIGGDFTQINSTPVKGAASFNIATGALITGWNPDINGTVHSIALSDDGGTVYTGGSFSSVKGGTTRNNCAAFNNTDGTPTAWNPDINGTVYSLAVNGTTVYAGGEFTNVNGGSPSQYLAAFNSGGTRIWGPEPNAPVYSLAKVGHNLFVGGAFNWIAGDLRHRIAAFYLSTGELHTGFTPYIDDPYSMGYTVYSLTTFGTSVLAGGYFTISGGGITETRHIAAFDTATGSVVSPADVSPDGTVTSVAVSGGKAAAGGNFSHFYTRRANLASYDAVTGEPTTWKPVVDDACSTMVVAGNNVYVGGDFSISYEQNKLAAFDKTTGALVTSWAPNVEGYWPSVYTLALSSDSNFIYAGGNFEWISGVNKRYLASIRIVDGGIEDWASIYYGISVRAIVVDGSTVYVGGEFGDVNGYITPNLAAIDQASGSTIMSWVPDISGRVNSIAVDGSNVYIGGEFANVNGFSAPRNGLAAFSKSSSVALDWDPRLNSGAIVYGLAVTDNLVYAGGTFTTVNMGFANRSRIAAFEKTFGGVDNQWIPSANSTVYHLTVSPNIEKLLVSGEFTTMTGVSSPGLAVLNNPDDPALPVEMTSFSAKMINGKVNLFWETKTEIDNHGFEVERRIAVGPWEKLGFVEGHGTSNSPKYYSFTDNEKPLGKTSYRLKQIDNDGTIDYSHIVEVSGELPSKVTLEQNFPNPFNPETVIRFALPASGSAIAGRVLIKVYDVTGKEVATPVNQSMEAGNHSVVFNATASGLPSGVYLYRLTVTTADGRQFTQTRKMMLMK